MKRGDIFRGLQRREAWDRHGDTLSHKPQRRSLIRHFPGLFAWIVSTEVGVNSVTVWYAPKGCAVFCTKSCMLWHNSLAEQQAQARTTKKWVFCKKRGFFKPKEQLNMQLGGCFYVRYHKQRSLVSTKACVNVELVQYRTVLSVKRGLSSYESKRNKTHLCDLLGSFQGLCKLVDWIN